jgi:hypothetical protein
MTGYGVIVTLRVRVCTVPLGDDDGILGWKKPGDPITHLLCLSHTVGNKSAQHSRGLEPPLGFIELSRATERRERKKRRL